MTQLLTQIEVISFRPCTPNLLFTLVTLVFVSLNSPVLAGKVPKFKPELKLLIPVEQLQREINSDCCPAVAKSITEEEFRYGEVLGSECRMYGEGEAEQDSG